MLSATELNINLFSLASMVCKRSLDQSLPEHYRLKKLVQLLTDRRAVEYMLKEEGTLLISQVLCLGGANQSPRRCSYSI